jgi:DNA excision repair protein ERCC-4
MEAFCLYLLRLSNSVAFIKAFSDSPEFLNRGFAKAEKILKTLRCSNILLYPRFHVEVNNELSHSSLEVIEIKVSPSQRMRMMQMSILAILQSSMGDVCKDNSVINKDEIRAT